MLSLKLDNESSTLLLGSAIGKIIEKIDPLDFEVHLNGNLGAGKTTLLGLLLKDAHYLLDSCDCESTQTSIRFCGCSTAAEEEVVVE